MIVCISHRTIFVFCLRTKHLMHEIAWCGNSQNKIHLYYANGCCETRKISRITNNKLGRVYYEYYNNLLHYKPHHRHFLIRIIIIFIYNVNIQFFSQLFAFWAIYYVQYSHLNLYVADIIYTIKYTF